MDLSKLSLINFLAYSALGIEYIRYSLWIDKITNTGDAGTGGVIDHIGGWLLTLLPVALFFTVKWFNNRAKNR